MFPDELPEFEKRPAHKVLPLLNSIFGGAIVKLIPHDDGHFRVVFDGAYFRLQGDKTAPSKSQWSTLKKKFKRRDRQIFVFKETGEVDCTTVTDTPPPNGMCYYLDFGYFAY